MVIAGVYEGKTRGIVGSGSSRFVGVSSTEFRPRRKAAPVFMGFIGSGARIVRLKEETNETYFFVLYVL